MKTFQHPFAKILSAAAFAATFANSASAQVVQTPTGVPVTRGKALNPDIGMNFLGLVQESSQGSDPNSSFPDGISFQEAELLFSADVDPYFHGVGLFSISQDPTTREFGFEPEEIYLETIFLPSVSLRAGKFKAAFGRHNLLHTHAFPFIDAPLILDEIFGDEGLNEMGISGAVLLPTPWFSEVTAQALSGDNSLIFNSPTAPGYAGVAHLKNLWDLSDSTTLEFGASGLTGGNSFDAQSKGWGTDLTLKWRPAEGGKYRAFIWSTEYMRVTRELDPAGEDLGGIASWFQYQFAERWWAQARVEFVGIPKPTDDAATTQKQSVLLGFFPTEFSGFRLQYDHLKPSDAETAEHRVALQWNISIGAHPAHNY